MKHWTAIAFAMALVAMLVTAGAASAQDKVAYKKRTIIDLSGAVIEGELTKPQGSMVMTRKLSRFSSLVRPRSDYWFELEFSNSDL